jgi:pimeloyl-ACP methyl ester carboxylesterase
MVLPIDDVDVHVTVRASEGTMALLYFGGNAEDVNSSLGDLAAAFPDRAIYLMHYRGYGGSSGKPSERALVADALSLFDKVRAEHDDVIAVGRSLGSGVAIQLASQRPVSRLVLVTPYDSILNLASRQFPYFPVRWLLLDKFESWRYSAAITAPTLVIAAEDDEVIPQASTQALVAHFPAGVATLKVVAGAGHNTISASPEYARMLAEAQR